jgi:polyisoprenyl-phosphate glycosyltransferase
MAPKLIIILPCYNEEEILQDSINEVSRLLDKMKSEATVSNESRMVLVDDGSKDSTWDIISKNSESPNVTGLKLAANAGHQNALMAGLLENVNRADIYLSIDADLQDDIEVIQDMVKSYVGGSQIVYGVRKDRGVDSFFKRKTAGIFYRVQELMGIKVVKHHADFRLISNPVLIELAKFKEVNLFLRAIFPTMGYNSALVYYNRKERKAGETKYPLKKMVSLAWDGITSFSTVPLRLVTVIGFLIFITSIGMSLYILGIKLFTDLAEPGWSSTILPIFFLGGIQLLFLGIIGEYIGKIYKEVKGRPRYIIEEEENGKS